MEHTLHSGTQCSGRPVIFISAVKFQFPSVPPVNFSAIMVDTIRSLSGRNGVDSPKVTGAHYIGPQNNVLSV